MCFFLFWGGGGGGRGQREYNPNHFLCNAIFLFISWKGAEQLFPSPLVLLASTMAYYESLFVRKRQFKDSLYLFFDSKSNEESRMK